MDESCISVVAAPSYVTVGSDERTTASTVRMNQRAADVSSRSSMTMSPSENSKKLGSVRAGFERVREAYTDRHRTTNQQYKVGIVLILSVCTENSASYSLYKVWSHLLLPSYSNRGKLWNDVISFHIVAKLRPRP